MVELHSHICMVDIHFSRVFYCSSFCEFIVVCMVGQDLESSCSTNMI